MGGGIESDPHAPAFRPGSHSPFSLPTSLRRGYTGDAMPFYEYRCHLCRKRTNIVVRSMGATVNAKCEHCGSDRLSRLISRVAVVRSGAGRANDLDERMLAEVDENDPRSVARFARRMRDEMGEEMGPDFDEAIEPMEAGELPDEGGADDWSLGED